MTHEIVGLVDYHGGMTDDRTHSPAALVTGSSRGIGAAIAVRCSAMGYAVVVNYVSNDASANAVVDEIRKAGGRAIAVRADVGDYAQVEHLVERTLDAFGGIRVIVNNAGLSEHRTLTELSVADWNRSIAVNLSSAMYTVKASLGALRDQPWARIINICSLRAMTGSDHGSQYAAAKSGLVGLTKSLALELAPSITVNAISPGYTRTDMTATALNTNAERIFAKIPAHRVAEPEEIAALAAFLASAEAGYITGQVINANGGIYM